MAKRLNPHRRLLARQAALRASAQRDSDPDRGMLQQGRVRSALTTIFSVGYHAPKGVAWEGKGVIGKVIRGRVKRVIPGTKQRFSPK